MGIGTVLRRYVHTRRPCEVFQDGLTWEWYHGPSLRWQWTRQDGVVRRVGFRWRWRIWQYGLRRSFILDNLTYDGRATRASLGTQNPDGRVR